MGKDQDSLIFILFYYFFLFFLSSALFGFGIMQVNLIKKDVLLILQLFIVARLFIVCVLASFKREILGLAFFYGDLKPCFWDNLNKTVLYHHIIWLIYAGRAEGLDISWSLGMISPTRIFKRRFLSGMSCRLDGKAEK